MNAYLLIESGDPFGSSDVGRHYELAAALAKGGARVTLFLVENGVLAARKNARADTLTGLAGRGVKVLADEFSLRERGIPADGLRTGVKPAPLDVVLDQLIEGRKVLWH